MIMWIRMTNTISKISNGIKNDKVFWLVFPIIMGGLLSACSTNPIGDFGRVDPKKAEHITRVQTEVIDQKNHITYRNPLSYSKLEKEFRLTAHLLNESNYNIALIDRLHKNESIDIYGPITEKALLHHFNEIGMDNVQDRFQSISADADKRIYTLTKFKKLVDEVMVQDFQRNYVENSLINLDIIEATKRRHAENIKLIKYTMAHMTNLYKAYLYVLNHGSIIEPTLDSSALRNKFDGLYEQVKQLNASIF